MLEVVEKLCDKVAIIKQGQLRACGRTAEVVGDESLEDVFLDMIDRGATASAAARTHRGRQSMRSFVLLLKIQLLGLFGIDQETLHADPAKARRTLALAALAVAAIVLFAACVLLSGVAQALVEIGLPEAVLLVAVLVGAVAGAVAAFLGRTACCSASRTTTW